MSRNEDILVGRDNLFAQTPIPSKKNFMNLKSSNLTSAKRRPLATLNTNKSNGTDCKTTEGPPKHFSNISKQVPMNGEECDFKKGTKNPILEDKYDEIENMIIEKEPIIDTYEDVMPLVEQPSTYVKQFIHWMPSFNRGSGRSIDDDDLKSDKDPPISPVKSSKDSWMRMTMMKEEMFDLPECPPFHIFDDFFL